MPLALNVDLVNAAKVGRNIAEAQKVEDELWQITTMGGRTFLVDTYEGIIDHPFVHTYTGRVSYLNYRDLTKQSVFWWCDPQGAENMSAFIKKNTVVAIRLSDRTEQPIDAMLARAYVLTTNPRK